MQGLLIMDFINDIAHPDGAISSASSYIQEHKTIENVNRLIAWGRSHKLSIGFVKVGFSPNYAECPDSSPVFSSAKKNQALKLFTWGTEFIETLDFQEDDTVITKHRVSSFYGTKLEPFLHAQKIDSLILAGVSTDMVVQQTAREAHDRDYLVTIASDGCAARSEKSHNMALSLCKRIATISTISEIIAH